MHLWGSGRDMGNVCAPLGVMGSNLERLRAGSALLGPGRKTNFRHSMFAIAVHTMGFHTETKYLLNPIPFAVRCYTLPDLFAGKMHALLFRKWKNRVKGRDWYDFIWYAANHPELHLSHLEQRMRQTEHWKGEEPLTEANFKEMLHDTIEQLDVEQAKKDVFPFLQDPRVVDIWSADFFKAVAAQLKFV